MTQPAPRRSEAPFVQPKLEIGAPDDKYERQADRVADEILRMPERTAALGACSPLEPPPLEGGPRENTLVNLRPMCAECDEHETVRRQELPLITPRPRDPYPVGIAWHSSSPDRFEKPDPPSGALDNPLHAGGSRHTCDPSSESTRSFVSHPVEVGIRALRGGGSTLPATDLGFYESRFGRDFSAVRLHTSTTADRLARAVRARAFTTGSDIVFAAGQFAPSTTAGRRLVAHELAHVVQQRGDRTSIVQRDLYEDLAGLDSVRVETRATRPRRHLRVGTSSGNVYSPYGIYRPSEVPQALRHLSMESREAAAVRNAVGTGRAPTGHISVDQLVRYEQQGPQVRLAIGRVNGQYRILAVDWVTFRAGESRTGWTENAPGVRGGGWALLEHRLRRAFEAGVETMRSEVGHGREVEEFHTELRRRAGLAPLGPDEYSYSLSVREMIRILLDVSRADNSLSPAQRAALQRLAEGSNRVTARQVARILRGGPGGPGGGSPPGSPGAPGSPSPTPSSALQPPSGATVRPGEWVVQSGEWYEVVQNAPPGQRVVQLQMGGQRVSAIRLSTGPAGAPRGLLIRGLGLLAAIAAIAGEVIAGVGRVMGSQRDNIARGSQEIRLWDSIGANPTTGLWEPGRNRPAPRGAIARATIDFSQPWTSWFGTHYLPYVADIDVAALRTELPSRVTTYQEFASFMELGQTLNVIEEVVETSRTRYFAIVNWVPRQRRRLEITSIVEGARTRILQRAQNQMRSDLAAVPAARRSGGRIVRLRRGANLLRTVQGEMPAITNASQHLGPDPWVRIVERWRGSPANWAFHGYWNDRLRVEPVNADAHRAATYARYVVRGSLEELWRRERRLGRQVSPSSLPQSGVLETFVSRAPANDPEVGTTVFTPDPHHPGGWSAATGELKSFWVSATDIAPLTDAEVEACIDQGRCRNRS